MEVAAVVAGEGFGQYDRGDLCGPQAAPSQFGEVGALSCQRADAAGVQDEGHAAPGCVPVSGPAVS